METGTCTIQHTITVCSTLVVCMEALRTTHLVCIRIIIRAYCMLCFCLRFCLPCGTYEYSTVRLAGSLLAPWWCPLKKQWTCPPPSSRYVCTCTYICTVSIRTYIRMQAHSSYVGPALSDLLPLYPLYPLYPLLPVCHDTYTYMRTYTGYVRTYVRTSLLLVSQWAGST